MSATFDGWPPLGSLKVIAACVVNSDGTLAATSKDINGADYFASATTGTGVYTCTPVRNGVAPILLACPVGSAARIIAVSGAVGLFTVRTFDAAGAAADGAFSLLYCEPEGR